MLRPREQSPRRGVIALLVLVALVGEGCRPAPPVIDSVSIVPAALDTDATASAHVVAHDPRGGTLSFAYQWMRNGQDIAGATEADLDLSVAGNGARGDTISVRVTVESQGRRSAPATGAALPVIPVVEVETRQSTEHYPIAGMDSAALFASIRRNGPRDGTTFASGLTQFEVSRTLRTVQAGSGCALDGLTIHNDIVVTLPRAEVEPRPADLQSKVERFVAAVDTHEERHVSIRRQYMQVLVPELRQIEPAASCEALQMEVARVIEGVIVLDERDQGRFHEEEEVRIQTACAPLHDRISTMAATLATLRTQPARYNALVPTYNDLVDDYNWCIRS